MSGNRRHTIERMSRRTHRQIKPNCTQVNKQRPHEIVSLNIVNEAEFHELHENENERDEMGPEVDHFVVV